MGPVIVVASTIDTSLIEFTELTIRGLADNEDPGMILGTEFEL
jgi:hypothetical protein